MGVINLYLDCSAAGTSLSPQEAQSRQQWLERVESLLRSVLLSKANRLETRMWLCAALAALPVPPSVQSHCFQQLMLHPFQPQQQGSGNRPAEDARIVTEVLVRLICENRAPDVARILAADPELLKRFFSENPKRILLWFENFGCGNQTDHVKGARALARFAFMHRETCWEELEWKGRHGQAPATVASKPHYFLELDVLQTVQNFLDYVPSFWSSEELWDSLQDGEFILLDREFFSQELLQKLLSQEPAGSWNVVKQYLEDESFSVLCNRILHLISDSSLIAFINVLAEELFFMSASAGQTGCPSHKFEHVRGISEGSRKSMYSLHLHLLELVLYSGSKCAVLEDAMIFLACAGHSRQILHLFHEEEYEEDALMLKQLISEAELRDKKQDHIGHWALRNEGLAINKWIIIKRLAVEAWFIFARLSENHLDTNFIEDVFRQNNIGFQQVDKTRERMGEAERLQGIARERKRKSRVHKKKKRKKRSAYYDSLESESDIGDDMDRKHVSESLLSAWRLSIDGYSSALQKGDLADGISSYALGEWIKWTAVHW